MAKIITRPSVRETTLGVTFAVAELRSFTVGTSVATIREFPEYTVANSASVAVGAETANLAENGDSEEDFSDFIWSKLSKHVVQTEDGGIQIIKENGDLWLDDKKNPLNLRGLFANFREGRGAKFFKPSNTSEGGGFVPQKGAPAATKTISREDATNPSAMRKAGVTIEDIANGKVQVI